MRCVAETVRLLGNGRIRWPGSRVDTRLRFADGTTGRVYRETVVDDLSREPCVLVVSFRLRFVHGKVMHALFRWESWLNTPLFVGFPGFVSKLWLAHDENDVYRGVYEWDGVERAEYYARCLWRVLALVSARGSIGYAIVPGVGRDRALADLPKFAVMAEEMPTWACPVEAEGGSTCGAMTRAHAVDGRVAAGFEPVRDAFVENFRVRGELGGAVCVVVGGEVVAGPLGWGARRTEWRALVGRHDDAGALRIQGLVGNGVGAAALSRLARP